MSIAMTDARWDRYYLRMALDSAGMSKDPSTRVGAVLIGSDRQIIGTGFNGFPRGIHDTPDRLNDRDTKLKLVVHAELNAVLNAARTGVSTRGSILFLVATDSSGMVWGGAPCVRCTVELIQAGIKQVVSPPFKAGPSRWADDIRWAKDLLAEAGVAYREVINHNLVAGTP